jgi:hypothetical protein
VSKVFLDTAGRTGTALPEQAPPVHHALHDARHDRLIAQSIGLIK